MLWTKARGPLRLPQLLHAGVGRLEGDAVEALFELSDDGVRLLEVEPRLDREPVWPDLLLDQIVSRLSAIRVQQTPLGFEADAWTGASAVVLRGLLLPFADATGALRHVKAIFGWRTLVPSSEALATAAALAHVSAPETQSVGLPRQGGVSAYDRLTVARTWAALAATDPVTRAVSLDAALSAIFDATLATRDPIAALVDDVLEHACSMSERRTFRRALAHGKRLGLAPGAFGPLLARYPGGARAMARIELWLQRYERSDEKAAERPIALRMRLIPAVADGMWPRPQGERKEVDANPWSHPVRAKAGRNPFDSACAIKTAGA